MTSANDLPRDEQYALVYAGICAVAAHCDGAITEDGVGFNGQDTAFGRRIASVPFEHWTDDVKVEAARIANTYQGQILAYTGIEIQKLPVVREAMGKDTNRQARDDARDFERRKEHITVNGGNLEFRFAYNPSLSDELKRHTMGARWNGAPEKCWTVPVAKQLPGFVAWVTDPALKFRFGAEVQAVLDRIATQTPEQVRAVAEKPHGYVLSGELVLSFPYNPTQKDAVKAAGARWEGSDKTWRVRLNDPRAAAVVAAARQVGLKVTTEVDVALGGAAKAEAVKLDRAGALVAASRVSRPSELSPEFLALVNQAISKKAS
ncbi:MAG TPA: hypothetical protein VFI41_05235 [Gemmatimonadales bacterium]|nr:hypothetical protein [Gemmatimonadales bacterium]